MGRSHFSDITLSVSSASSLITFRYVILHESRAVTQTIVEPPCKKSICNGHCALVAVLCISAKQVKVL